VSEIVILIPVLDRPKRVAPLIASVEAASRVIKQVPLFLVSPGDEAELLAVKAADAEFRVMPFERGPGDYARKMNYGIVQSSAEFIFLGADDLFFVPGWAERALACWAETHACVVGTNDLGSMRVQRGQHSTHSLFHRDYCECGSIDDKKRLLHEGYFHNFVDDEFVQTAIFRETYYQALDSHVEHLHPDWGKARADKTYIIGKEHFNDDRAHYNERRGLWNGAAR
jgi:glycosyltransferase involved in cell wall biosynthesis